MNSFEPRADALAIFYGRRSSLTTPPIHIPCSQLVSKSTTERNSHATIRHSGPAEHEELHSGRNTEYFNYSGASTMCVHAPDTPRFYQSLPGKQNRIAQRTGELNAQERE